MFKWKQSKNDLDVDIRFLLANERTLLAWVRTGLTLIAGGVAVAFISSEQAYGTVAGIGAIVFGAVLAIIGFVRYQVADAAIRAGKLPASGISGVIVVVAVAIFAALLLVARQLQFS